MKSYQYKRPIKILPSSFSVPARLCLFLGICFLAIQAACSPPFFDSGQNNAGVYNDLVLKIDVNRSRVRAGESAKIQFTVTNGGSQPVVIESNEAPVMDILLEEVGSGGTILYSWSGQNPSIVQNRIEWKPGEAKSIDLVWTPTQVRDTIPGQLVGVIGNLRQGSKNAQQVTVTICLGISCW